MDNAEEKAKLLKSLEKGNQYQVTFMKDGKEEKMNIEACSQFKNPNLYDSKMQKVYRGVEEDVKELEKSQEKKEVQKQEVD